MNNKVFLLPYSAKRTTYVERKITMKKFVYEPEKTTLLQYLDYWFIKYIAIKVRESTYDSYHGYIYNHIVPKIGNVLLKDIDLDILQDFFIDEKAHGNLRNKNKELSPKTLNNMRNMLNEALDKAVSLRYIDKNWLSDVELPRVLQPEIAVFSVEAERLILDKSISDEYLEYGFSYWLSDIFGLRCGENVALKWSDFDFKHNEFRVCRTIKRVHNHTGVGAKTYLKIGQPKTQQANRTIPFTDDIKEKIISIMRRREGMGYYSSRKASKKMKDYIFLSTIGELPDPDIFGKKFKDFIAELGIDDADYSFHSLRHTFITRGIEKGVDIKALSEIAGHSSVQFTLDRYAHVLQEHKRRVMETLLSDK